MKNFAVLFLGACTVLSVLCGSAKAADLPVCSKEQLFGYVPTNDEVKAHRPFALPVISYPYATKPFLIPHESHPMIRRG